MRVKSWRIPTWPIVAWTKIPARDPQPFLWDQIAAGSVAPQSTPPSVAQPHDVVSALVALTDRPRRRCRPPLAPFARLDPYHTAKVVAVVPDMSPQVILLVQEGELSRDDAKRLLGDRLVYEFTLHREGARESSVTGRAPE